MVQWLRLHIPNAGDMGLIPDQGAKISHAKETKKMLVYVCIYVCVYIYTQSIHVYVIVCVYIYSGILFSHKREENDAICSKMDGPRGYHTK